MITTPVSIRVSLTFLAVFTFIFRIPSLLSVVLCFFHYTIPRLTTQQQSAANAAPCCIRYFFQWARPGTTASMWALTCSAGHCSLAMWVTQKSISCSMLLYLNVPPS